MADSFPIAKPERLPLKIEPCPIVEAVLELRFVTQESWRTLPGLFFANIRDRFPEQADLPLASVPEEVRRSEPAFRFQPLVRFSNSQFFVQLGPQVVSLVTKTDAYPGWAAVETEITWLLQRLKIIGFISEAERLAARYINFFDFDIFPKLLLEVRTGGKHLKGADLSIATVLRQEPLVARLQVANRAFLGAGTRPRHGSVFDLDVWVRALDFDLFENGLQKFREAHHLEKQIFFGLLKPDFLATLNPVYE